MLMPKKTSDEHNLCRKNTHKNKHTAAELNFESVEENIVPHNCDLLYSDNTVKFDDSDLNKNIKISSDKEHFIKPCHVLLKRIDLEKYLKENYNSSNVKPRMDICSRENYNTLSKNLSSDKTSETTEMSRKSFTVENIHGVSASNSLKSENVHYYSVNSCYVKIERLSDSVKCHENLSKNSIYYEIKRQECDEEKNHEAKRTSDYEYLSNKKIHLLQSDDIDIEDRLNESYKTFPEKLVKPCSVKLIRCVNNHLSSDIKHAYSYCEINTINENSMSESFISASLLSTPETSIDFKTNGEMQESDHSILKCSKRKLKLLSSSSSSESNFDEEGRSKDYISENKFLDNFENDFCKRKKYKRCFSLKKVQRNTSSKKGEGSHFPTFVNSSSNSSGSMLFNDSISVINSPELIDQDLKERTVNCDFPPASLIGTITREDSVKSVLCEQNQNSSDIKNVKNRKSTTMAYGSSYMSDTEENLSDDYYNKLNAERFHLKYSKMLSHMKSKSTTLFNTFSKEESGMKTSKEKCSSLSRNTASHGKGNGFSVKYNLKPCFVPVRRIENLDLLVKGVGEKSNHDEENLYKSDSDLVCDELSCNKQIKSSRKVNISKEYKPNKSAAIGKNNVSVSVKDESETCVYSEFEKDCTSDGKAYKNSVGQIPDPSNNFSRTASSSKSYKKCVPNFSDDSDSLPDINQIFSSFDLQNKNITRKLKYTSAGFVSTSATKEIIDKSMHINKDFARKMSSEKDISENGKRIGSNRKMGVVSDEEEYPVIENINYASNNRSILEKNKNDGLSGRIRNDDKIIDACRLVNKHIARRISSESEDSICAIKNRKIDQEIGVINDEESHVRNIDDVNKNSSSDRLFVRTRTREKITKHVNKHITKKLSSESDDTVVENGKRTDHETGVIDAHDNECCARDIDNVSNNSNVRENNKSDRLLIRTRRREKVTKLLNKRSRVLSSECANTVTGNDHEISIISTDEDESHVTRNINNVNSNSNFQKKYKSDRLSNRIGIRYGITDTKHVNKYIGKKMSSESDDTVIENCKGFGDQEIGVISNESRVERNIDNASNNSSVQKNIKRGRLSGRIRTRDDITNASKCINKHIARKISSESDTMIENQKKIGNDQETNAIVDDDDDEWQVSRDSDTVNDKSISSRYSESDRLLSSVIGYDSDADKAYFADTDDYNESDFVNESDNCTNGIFQENRPSSGLTVNPLECENKDGSTLRKRIPYCYLGSKNSTKKYSDNIFVFKSQVNGSVYIVDLFEYENIRKIFVTIRFQEKANVHVKNALKKNSCENVSDKMKALGCFEENARICDEFPNNLSNINLCDINERGDFSSSQCGSNKLDCEFNDVLHANKNYAKLDDACYEQGASCSQTSSLKDTTVASCSNDHFDEFTDHCVHCFKKFVNKKESYDHTCTGKLEKGFLCMYCEKLFSSYSKLLYHKKTHFI